MDKEFVPYEQALELKELGFDEPCLGWYQDNTLRLDINSNQSIKFHEHLGRFKECFLAPLYQQAFRWFREKHGLLFWIEPSFKNQYQTDGYVYYVKNNGSYSIDYATYEQAEIACLKKLIEILKTK